MTPCSPRRIGTRPSGFVRRGAAVGATVAREILAWRQNDGWVVSPFPPYSEPLLPGTLAADAAGQRERGVHPSSVRRAAGAADVDAVPAACRRRR